MQQMIVILIVLGACVWLGYYVYRFFVPASKAGGCAGGCCAGAKEEVAKPKAAPTMFVSSEDLARRVKARRG